MCGIVGEFAIRGSADADSLRRMTQALTHRGPDDEGYYIRNNVGLGFRRLSIIDIAGGNQPIFNEDESLCIICNGEIYNYRELRRELTTHRFRTQSDAEVALHLFEEHGPDAFGMLNGMFALAILDAPNNTLYCARDRFGQKPLHYYHNPTSGVVFASEIRALRLHRRVHTSLDETALPFYWFYNYIPAPRSAFRGINKLPPQSYMIVDSSGVQVRHYDVPDYFTCATDMEFTEVTQHCEQLLRAAVHRHLIADVDVGMFLSGGVDSTVILKYAVEAQPGIQAFCATFGDHISEYPYVQQACAAYGVRPRVMDLHPDPIAIERAIGAYSEPFGDSACVPTYLLSAFAARSVKSVLTGEGGDEVFGGYDQYRELATAGQAATLQSRYLRSRAYAGLDHMQRQYQADCAALREHVENLELRSLEGVMQHELAQRLPDNHFTKVDTASMQHGLEARCPFLDHALVDFVSALPLCHKVTADHRKLVLRSILGREFPPEFIDRPKWGFGAPVQQWMAEEPLRGALAGVFNQETANLCRLLTPNYRARLMRPLSTCAGEPLTYEHWKVFTLLVWLRNNGIAM